MITTESGVFGDGEDRFHDGPPKPKLVLQLETVGVTPLKATSWNVVVPVDGSTVKLSRYQISTQSDKYAF